MTESGVRYWMRRYGLLARTLSEAGIGRVQSPETRAKQSVSKMGELNPNYQKPLTLEQKRKISKSLKGKQAKQNHWNWKGGITPLNNKIRNLVEYKLWRQEVYERDNYTCQHCYTKGAKLNADHIKPFALILKENEIDSQVKAIKCKELWDIKNGRTLCMSCHEKTPTFKNHKNVLEG